MVVCTAAVLLNVLNNAYWKMEDVSDLEPSIESSLKLSVSSDYAHDL